MIVVARSSHVEDRKHCGKWMNPNLVCRGRTRAQGQGSQNLKHLQRASGNDVVERNPF